ncbi:MAG: hypothetical protein WA604_12880, partial [Candidatus Sulfotelmatobacter sp.]
EPLARPFSLHAGKGSFDSVDASLREPPTPLRMTDQQIAKKIRKQRSQSANVMARATLPAPPGSSRKLTAES